MKRHTTLMERQPKRQNTKTEWKAYKRHAYAWSNPLECQNLHETPKYSNENLMQAEKNPMERQNNLVKRQVIPKPFHEKVITLSNLNAKTLRHAHEELKDSHHTPKHPHNSWNRHKTLMNAYTLLGNPQPL